MCRGCRDLLIDAQLQGLCKAWLYQELTSSGIKRENILSHINQSDIVLLEAINNALRWTLRARYTHWLYSAGEQFRPEFAFENMSNILSNKLRTELLALGNWIEEAYQHHGH